MQIFAIHELVSVDDCISRGSQFHIFESSHRLSDELLTEL